MSISIGMALIWHWFESHAAVAPRNLILFSTVKLGLRASGPSRAEWESECTSHFVQRLLDRCSGNGMIFDQVNELASGFLHSRINLLLSELCVFISFLAQSHFSRSV